jgi:hypothetical protein
MRQNRGEERSLYKKKITELDKLVDSLAVPYNGNYRFF